MAEKLEANVTGNKGEKLVKKRFESLGFKVIDVSREQGVYCDFIILDEVGNKKLIEVKTTARKDFAIPDMHENQILKGEMGEAKSIYADEVWVVVNALEEPEYYVITKGAFEQMFIEKPDATKSKIQWIINDNIAKEYAERMD